MILFINFFIIIYFFPASHLYGGRKLVTQMQVSSFMSNYNYYYCISRLITFSVATHSFIFHKWNEWFMIQGQRMVEYTPSLYVHWKGESCGRSSKSFFISTFFFSGNINKYHAFLWHLLFIGTEMRYFLITHPVAVVIALVLVNVRIFVMF